MDEDEELVEVLRTTDQMVAQAAIDEVLTPAGIAAVVHDRVSHRLPAPASMPGGYFVAVPIRRRGEAAAALNEAITDGVIDGEIVADVV
jgi:hypothetical protein